MKLYIFLFVLILGAFHTSSHAAEKDHIYKADNPLIQYVGRIDFSNKELPRFYAPGVYVTFTFRGSKCTVQLNDEVLYNKNHNYITIVIDGGKPSRIQLKEKQNDIQIAKKLSNGVHTVVVCKDTESGIGYLEFVGIRCKKLLPSIPKPERRLEFIGNSITCGTGSDLTIPCDTKDWYDQHNAYLAYGPSTARNLNAQWHLTAVSGIGLTRSCCDLKNTLPDVFDKINLRENELKWNFAKYQPDVVSICLGQNDGFQDSVTFTSAYVNFIQKLRSVYPKATILCLTSPMADEKLNAVLKKYLTEILAEAQKTDHNVYKYFYSKRYFHGCGTHPDLAEHKQMASELTAYIKEIKHW
ncbi:lysophospholipase L1-like esterase [Pedobacter sp. UYEF25]